ncbi:MAG: TlpA family protein disulfide reductase [Gammaproteobacteria bacterium]|nr:TlpA family protein disulfide reductase [Gammaproteobacteria bacterium]
MTALKHVGRRRWWLTILLLIPLLSAAGSLLVLQEPNGKRRDAREFIGHGRWTVVMVWSVDCLVCQREIHHMTSFYEAHKHDGLRVLGLSIDGHWQRQRVEDFIAVHSLNFPILIGDTRDPMRLSGRPFIATPTYYFFAPNGAFRAIRIGAMDQKGIEQLLDALRGIRR